MAQWSPSGHSLAIVVKNDLYYFEDASSMSKVKRITTSGVSDLFFNGITDWLYEGKAYSTPVSFFSEQSLTSIFFLQRRF